jgi:hypothetical protein
MCILQRGAEIVDFYVKYLVLLQRIVNLGTGTSQISQMILILLFCVCGEGRVVLSV